MQTLSYWPVRLLPVCCGFFALVAGAGAAPAMSPQRCEALALARPGHLEGRYVTYTVPNNNWYTMHGSLSAIGQCAAEGTRKVVFEQQKQEPGIGLHPKLEWLTNSFPLIAVKGNQAKRVQSSVRAPHECWPTPIGAYGDFDKTRHIKARMTAIVTWTLKGGQPVSKTFTSTPQAVCR